MTLHKPNKTTLILLYLKRSYIPLLIFCLAYCPLNIAEVLIADKGGFISLSKDNTDNTDFSNAFWGLCYHDVRDSVDGDMDSDSMAVSSAHLIQHFEWLRENNYHPVSVDQIVAAKNGGPALPEKAILLSFDDGYTSFYDTIFPLLKLYQYPAVMALVTSWLEVPSGERVLYGKESLPREAFLSWSKIREMKNSGLVEIASHSHDMHKGIISNPQGNKQAGFVTRQYMPNLERYETEKNWHNRVTHDLRMSANLIYKHTGMRPRTIVWPYGRYSPILEEIATSIGMTFSLGLQEKMNSAEQQGTYQRNLISNNPSLASFKYALSPPTTVDPQRVVHIDMDYIYDKDPAQQDRNLGKLLDRILAMKVSTVYLQAFSDADGDGNAEGLYFPNHHLPMRADLFNRVAWQLYTRASVENIYAWMPVSAFVLDEATMQRLEVMQYKEGKVQAANNTYRRLSVFKPETLKIISDIYQDLAMHAEFSGLLFHDDALLTDFEDVSAEAMAYYQHQGLPTTIDELRSAQWMQIWAKVKTQALTNFTLQLADVVRRYRPTIKTARNIYAMPIMKPVSQQWFAQSLKNFHSHYDYTAVMAMPYMENAEDSDAWLTTMVANIKAEVGLEKVVFELQSRDWRHKTDIPTKTLVQQMQLLQRAGVKHFGYYPDDFHRNQPELEHIRKALSVETFPFERR